MCLISFSVNGADNQSLNNGGNPTEVYVIGAILDVDKINSAEQNFTLNLYLLFRWTDSRLVHDGVESIMRPLSEVWNPRLTIMNTQRQWKNTRDVVEIAPDGSVTFRLHVFGNFSQPLELHDFPHDSHTFEVPVVAAGFRPHQLALKPLPTMETFVSEKLSVADWRIKGVRGESRDVKLSNGLMLPGFVISFEGERLVHHYVVKAIIPLVLIVMMSWVVFWIDPAQVPNQLSVAVTTVLTLIAYHIALSGRLPDIPYLTQMDKFLFGSTVLVFMSLIEVVVTSHLSSTEQLGNARRIDKTARVLFPILFLSVFGFSFL